MIAFATSKIIVKQIDYVFTISIRQRSNYIIYRITSNISQINHLLYDEIFTSQNIDFLAILQCILDFMSEHVLISELLNLGSTHHSFMVEKQVAAQAHNN